MRFYPLKLQKKLHAVFLGSAFKFRVSKTTSPLGVIKPNVMKDNKGMSCKWKNGSTSFMDGPLVKIIYTNLRLGDLDLRRIFGDLER